MENVYNELLPAIQKGLEFVFESAFAGVIGNQADNWFSNLFFYQQQRLQNWISYWEPNKNDLLIINSDERVKELFSKITKEVSDELFADKIIMWANITDTVIRNKEYDFDKKLYYTNLLIKLEPFVIHYMATLYVKNGLSYNIVFPNRKFPRLGYKHFNYYLSQNICKDLAFTLIYMHDDDSIIRLTEFGKDFIDFVGGASLDKINELAR